jgi:hypothetical protein
MGSFSYSKIGMTEAMHRQGWYMPLARGFVTLEYIQLVRERKVWCPAYSEIRLLPCPTPSNQEGSHQHVIHRSR